jgi:hypothetical protein
MVQATQTPTSLALSAEEAFARLRHVFEAAQCLIHNLHGPMNVVHLLLAEPRAGPAVRPVSPISTESFHGNPQPSRNPYARHALGCRAGVSHLRHAAAALNVRYRKQTGQHMFSLVITACDPKRTYNKRCRPAKAIAGFSATQQILRVSQSLSASAIDLMLAACLCR